MKTLALLFCTLSSLLTALYEEVDITQPLRIHSLIPHGQFLVTLGIDPALPAEFIALDPPKELEDGWIYWGKESVLQAYFKPPHTPSEAMIRMSISPNIAQEGMNDFNEAKIRKEFASDGLDKALSFGHLGRHPYFSFVGQIENSTVVTAWVGANAEGGHVLQFQLIAPEKEGKPTEEALALWNRFFKESKGLPDPLLFKAFGQEMHTGYTIIETAGCKAKITAERRRSDRKVQFIFEPLMPNLSFTYKGSHQGFLGSEWRQHDAVLKVEGTLELRGDHSISLHFPASIFIRETDEFSSYSVLKKNLFAKQV